MQSEKGMLRLAQHDDNIITMSLNTDNKMRNTKS